MVRRIRIPDLAAVALTLGANGLVHRVLPESTHVPANLAAAAALVGIARVDGATWDDLGLDPASFGRGLRYGTIAATAIAGGVAAAAAIPALREHFLDERVVAVSNGRAAYEIGVRIPFGTALAEEVIYRAALPAIIGAAPSTALFGLAHALPTASSLDTHPAGEHARTSRLRSAAAVGSVVLITGAAGFAFRELRRRSGSVLAPVMAHAALNASTYVAARTIARRAT